MTSPTVLVPARGSKSSSSVVVHDAHSRADAVAARHEAKRHRSRLHGRLRRLAKQAAGSLDA